MVGHENRGRTLRVGSEIAVSYGELLDLAQRAAALIAERAPTAPLIPSFMERSIASIAVAIAGFSGVVVALTGKTADSFGRAERLNLRILLQVSAFALLFSLVQDPFEAFVTQLDQVPHCLFFRLLILEDVDPLGQLQPLDHHLRRPSSTTSKTSTPLFAKRLVQIVAKPSTLAN